MEGTIYLFEVCKILRVQGLYEQIQKEFEEKGVLIPIVYAITKEAPSTPLHNQIFDNGCFATKITMSNDEKKWAVCTGVKLVDGVFNGARKAIAVLLHELGHLYHQDIPETFDDLKIGAQIVDGILIDESAELRADAYAAKYGYGDELKQFLIKLVNSSNVDNQNLRHIIDNRIAALQNYKEEVC